jgi:hypothetical protein
MLEEQLAERAQPGPDGLVFVNTRGTRPTLPASRRRPGGEQGWRSDVPGCAGTICAIRLSPWPKSAMLRRVHHWAWFVIVARWGVWGFRLVVLLVEIAKNSLFGAGIRHVAGVWCNSASSDRVALDAIGRLLVL